MNNIQSELLDWAKNFEDFRLPKWDHLPNIDYYMDQVIEYIQKYVSILNQDDPSKVITPSMINNYVKLGLIPAPIKKRYSKVHLANLIVITIIKQVCVISNIKDAINFQMQADGGRNSYNLFCTELENALKNIYTSISNGKIYLEQDISINNTAVKCISQALAFKILALKTTEICKNNIKGDL